MKVVYFPALTLKAKHSKRILLTYRGQSLGRADAKGGGRGGHGLFARKRVALPKYINEQIDK